MSKKSPFFLFVKSFSFAGKGIFYSFSNQRNIWIQLIIAISVISFGIYLKIDFVKISILVLTCTLVLSLEILNTSLERLIDKVHPKRNQEIGRVKDGLAGSVLVASIASVAIAFLIFFEPLKELLFELAK